MAFDSTQPAPNVSLRLSNPLILANWAALGDALSREHNFPGTMGSTAGQHKYMTLADQESDPDTPDSGKSVLYSKSGLPYQRNSSGDIYAVIRFITGGTHKQWFCLNVAPLGWTIDATAADCLIGVKGGDGLFNVSGGSDAGSWTPTPHAHGVTMNNHVHAGPAHSHTTGDVTLTAAQSGLPEHSHYISGSNGSGSYGRSWGFPSGFAIDVVLPTTGIAGGAQNASQPHNHGSTGSSGTGNTSSAGGETVTSANGASPNTDRPKSRIGIICSLN